MDRKTEAATYTHGHHASVLRSHRWRTALNSAAYLLPHLGPGMRVLDVGCGPGTITVDLAAHVSPGGSVTGVERAGDAVLAQARALAAERGVADVVAFVAGDANALAFADGSFDVVVCHQLLQHVRDPVAVLAEMRRVARPDGGIVAARESDYASFAWYPVDGHDGGLDAWRRLYRAVARANGGEPDAGRMVHAWARRAGFARHAVASSASTWCFRSPDEIAWWSGLWAERTVASAFAQTAVDAGLATEADLERVAAAWRRWGDDEDAWFTVVHGEVICRREA
ncbi:methyltransferase [Hirsutella rhossiliensis]|uniref:Methyltransferase domain-containing protein n=1 Tax=Hirsutella rhossiliensis TaxID=111463 RepID=A0A9P8SM61_9HYPO|nr:methyltransferase domain-containing protein [Hirsutella rhossiliensis]KAH0966500.1 methyltransferase domain-containing protein [Hirsutella rhossiliensis]